MGANFTKECIKIYEKCASRVIEALWAELVLCILEIAVSDLGP
jgi:hypothetical protein